MCVCVILKSCFVMKKNRVLFQVVLIKLFIFQIILMTIVTPIDESKRTNRDRHMFAF